MYHTDRRKRGRRVGRQSGWLALRLFVGIFVLPFHAVGQPTYVLSGTLRDAQTGEALIGATVTVKELPSVGATSNAYGFYSLSLPSGTYSLNVRYVGYLTIVDSVRLDRGGRLDFRLMPNPVRLAEVVVQGEQLDRNVASTDMGVNELDLRTFHFAPVLLGERDVLKTVQLLPGIKPEGEGRTGIIARGGGADQNLVLLDEAPIYNTSHLLGFLSVFNSDAIRSVKSITGGIPAEYGGRLSSVLDIRTSDGNEKEFDATGGIGLIASRGMLTGPLGKESGSFLLSARRTYADLFLGLAKNATTRRTSLYFYDLNLKANHKLGDDDRLFVTGYMGRDHFVYPDVLGFDWGNNLATLRWTHLFSGKLFSSTSLIYSNYDYTNMLGSGVSQYDVNSGIRDLNLKTDYQLFLASSSSLKFGLNGIYHSFSPGTATPGPEADPAMAFSVPTRNAVEGAAYLSHETELTKGVRTEYGLRVSFFRLTAPAGAGLVKTYGNFEPRAAINVRLDEASSVKASYTRMAQYLHLVANFSPTNPSSVWVPSSGKVNPAYADQVSLGYFRNFGGNAFETSVEVYYKDMRNLVEPRSGTDILLNPTLESSLLRGRGWSYGAEFLVKKTAGKLTGWIGYTLSRTMEKFAELNQGDPFPARQDRTHDVSVVAVYDLSPRWHFSAAWVYSTGNAVTFPVAMYAIDGRAVAYYSAFNSYRMPAYHRLDISATYAVGERSSLNFSVYNVYNRANAFAIVFRANREDFNKSEAMLLTLFPIIPSVTYNFAF